MKKSNRRSDRQLVASSMSALVSNLGTQSRVLSIQSSVLSQFSSSFAKFQACICMHATLELELWLEFFRVKSIQKCMYTR